MPERDWREMFELDHPTIKTEKKCTCGNGNCRTAKRIKCTCRCHAAAHGIDTRQGMSALETFNEPQQLEVEVIAA